MPINVNTNGSRFTDLNQLNSSNLWDASWKRLINGIRIKGTFDDASLQISNRLHTQSRGLSQAHRNAADGISILQTAEGAMIKVINILERIYYLIQESINSAADRAAINEEVQELIKEIDRIANETTFGGNKIFNTTFRFDIDDDVLSVSLPPVRSIDLGVSSNFSTIIDESDSNFASRLRTQFASALSTFKLNDVTLTDVAANQNAVNKMKAVNSKTSDSGVSAFIFGNSLVGTINTTNAAGAINSSEIVVNDIEIDGSDGTVADMVAKINLKKGQHGVVANATAGDTLVLFNRDGKGILLKVNSANAASATGFNDGSVNSVAADEKNGAIVLYTTGVGNNTVTVDNSITAAALNGSTDDASTIALTDISVADTDINTTGGVTTIAELVLNAAINTLNAYRSTLGGLQNRFSDTISNLDNLSENVNDAKACISDTDLTTEATAMTKSQILDLASSTALAQANKTPSSVLSLLE